MRIAIISDIHSNNIALEAVLKDIYTKDVDSIVCTGDIVGYMPNPNEVIDLIRQHKILCIKGNHDLHTMKIERLNEEQFQVLDNSVIQQSASAIYTNYILEEKNRVYLANLPEKIEMSVNGFKVLFVHGSPRAIDEYMYEDAPYLNEIMEELEYDVVIAGHTHIPYYKQVRNKFVINAGSVGKPKHGNSNATYVILSVEKGNINVVLREVPYDVKKMKEEIIKNLYIPDHTAQSI